jgi:hypothetical protein
MPADRVIIEELFLKLPGVSDQEARAISGEVARRIGRGLEDAVPLRDLGALEIRLTARQGASRDELVDSVARAVITALAR